MSEAKDTKKIVVDSSVLETLFGEPAPSEEPEELEPAADPHEPAETEEEPEPAATAVPESAEERRSAAVPATDFPLIRTSWLALTAPSCGPFARPAAMMAACAGKPGSCSNATSQRLWLPRVIVRRRRWLRSQLAPAGWPAGP